MPLVEKLDADLWEVRIRLPDGIARVLFTIHESEAILLHGIREEKQEDSEGRSRNRQTAKEAAMSKRKTTKKASRHVGSNFEDFLREEGRLEESTALALKRVLAWEFQQAMEKANVSQAEMARRMHTSRAVIRRLLDQNDPSVTLTTLTKAASALGKNLRLKLAA